MNPEMSIRLVRELASCNGCAATNYESSIPGYHPKKCEKLYDVIIGRAVIRLCPNCMKDLSNLVVDELRKNE